MSIIPSQAPAPMISDTLPSEHLDTHPSSSSTPPPAYQDAWNYGPIHTEDSEIKHNPAGPPLPITPTIGTRLDELLDRIHRLFPINIERVRETVMEKVPEDLSFTGPFAPIWVPLNFLGLNRFCPEATLMPPIVPTQLNPAPTGESTQEPSPRKSLWKHMKLIMLDRGTTFSLLLFVFIKPFLAIINLLYVVCIIIPLTVTGIIFFVPSAISYGPSMSLLQGYAGFIAWRLCETEAGEDVGDMMVSSGENAEANETGLESRVGRLVDIEEGEDV
ncbi:hypothetical protein HDU67_004634 [Dinochytrium kinnereticum]|nr:hypothetical protein HDU67_004634 [Dinochytrium kinnereticum]